MALRVCLLLSALSLIGLCSHAEAQPKWHVYTAPDKRFSVELPWKPYYTRRRTVGMQGGPGGVVAFRGTSSVDIYNLRMYGNEDLTAFVINVYTLSERDSEK